MAENSLGDIPELTPFVLSNVQLTGNKIGAGAYGSVEEVIVPVNAAAKRIHEVFQDRNEIPDDEIERASAQFVKECQLMSTLRHPNIVQFLGVCFVQSSRLPALVMERQLTSLHDLLDPETQPLPGVPTPSSFFSLGLKCRVLHNVASGLDYLHGQTPRVVHRDLSARNILLGSRLVAKIADLGVARIVPPMKSAATMTKAPGASVYMPPEAVAPSTSNDQKSKYDVSIDVFSFGVVAIFTIGDTFPCDLLAPTYHDDESGLLVPRTELQRRSEYMQYVNIQLQACGQMCKDHPLIRLIEECLNNSPLKRPNISGVLHLLKEARDGITDEKSEINKEKLVQTLQKNQPTFQNLEHIFHDMVMENAQLQHKIECNTQQLMRKEAELTMAEETIMREQQTIQEMRRQGTEIEQANDRELAEAQQQVRQLKQLLTEKEHLLQVKERELAAAQQQMGQLTFACKVSGPGLQSASVNQPTHIIVELSDSTSGRPCLFQQNVIVELERISEATPTSSQQPLSEKPGKCDAVVAISPSRYEASFTAVNRGQHKIHVLLNNEEIDGSPFTITVYPDPTQLGNPVRVVTGLYRPYGIAVNSCGEMIISECDSHCISIIDDSGQKTRIFGSHGDGPEQMKSPVGIAVDDADNIYVSSWHKLQKFTNSGELLKCVGQKGSEEEEFDDPRGIALYDSHAYVCDYNNHRIQVFDMDLKFIRSIGSHGKESGEFDAPHDVTFDTSGNMYVYEFNNQRVQVMDTNGCFIRTIGHEEKGEMRGPSALHIVDKYVYLSDCIGHCVVVYETSGQLVTSFGTHGHKEGEFYGPHCITSCCDGFLYVCDCWNKRVQIF